MMPQKLGSSVSCLKKQDRRSFLKRTAMLGVVSAAAPLLPLGLATRQAAAQVDSIPAVGRIISNYLPYVTAAVANGWAVTASPIVFGIQEPVQRGYVTPEDAYYMGSPVVGYLSGLAVKDGTFYSQTRTDVVLGYASEADARTALELLRSAPMLNDARDFSESDIQAFLYFGQVAEGVIGPILVHRGTVGPFLIQSTSRYVQEELSSIEQDASRGMFRDLLAAYANPGQTSEASARVLMPVQVNGDVATGSIWARLEGEWVPVLGSEAPPDLSGDIEPVTAFALNGSVPGYALYQFTDQSMFIDERSAGIFSEDYEVRTSEADRMIGISVVRDPDAGATGGTGFFVRWAVPGGNVQAGYRVVSGNGETVTVSTLYNSETPYDLAEIDPSHGLFGPVRAASLAFHEQLVALPSGPIISIQI